MRCLSRLLHYVPLASMRWELIKGVAEGAPRQGQKLNALHRGTELYALAYLTFHIIALDRPLRALFQN